LFCVPRAGYCAAAIQAISSYMASEKVLSVTSASEAVRV